MRVIYLLPIFLLFLIIPVACVSIQKVETGTPVSVIETVTSPAVRLSSPDKSVPSSTPAKDLPTFPILTPTAQYTDGQAFKNGGGTKQTTIPNYSITGRMDYDNGKVDIQQTLEYWNSSDVDITDFLLAVQPNRIPGVFDLQDLEWDGRTISDYSLIGQRLYWQLPAPLQPGKSVIINILYRLDLPNYGLANPAPEYPRLFGIQSRQVNLNDWYPMIVPFIPGQGWQLAEPVPYAEHLVYPLANFEVSLLFAQPETMPVIAASAPVQPVDGGYHFTLLKARNFSLAMGRHLQLVSSNVDGVVISSYYYPGNKPMALAVLDTTQKSLQLYSRLFGKYPHETLAVVQGDSNDGMEYDGLYYLSNNFYQLYDGTPNNLLVLIAAHETCHQWWFGRVASDQAFHPWQDEALSTYCELLFYENYYPFSLKWWWSYRIDLYQPTGKIDNDIYSYGSFKPYTNIVYRQGARFLDELRLNLGDKAFFEFLGSYSAQMNGQIATPEDFFRILGENTTMDLSNIISTYFTKSVP